MYIYVTLYTQGNVKNIFIPRKYSNKNSYKADTKDPSKCDDDLR